MMGLVVEQVRENIAPLLFELLARRGRVFLQSLDQAVVKRCDIRNDAVVLVGARQRQRAAVLINNGVELAGMLAFAGQPLQPQPVGQQQMIERAVHALEEGADVAPVLGIAQTECRLIEPGIGPAVIGGALFEIGFHPDAPSLPPEHTRGHGMGNAAADCRTPVARLIFRSLWRCVASPAPRRRSLAMLVPIDRRDFLRHAAALGIALPFAGSAAAAESELVARTVFFDNPDIGSVRISPDGQTLSWLAPIENVRNLFVAPRDDLNAARAVTHATDRNLATFYRWAHTNRHLVFFQERDGDENWRASSVDLVSGAIVPLTPERGVKAYWHESDRKFPEEMLFTHNARDKRYFDLFRVNLVTGKSDLVFENNEFAWYVTDSDFQLRIGVRFMPDGSAEWLERRADGSWGPFLNVPIADFDQTQAVGFSADGKTLFMLDSRGRDKAALFAVDMATRQGSLLAADEEADIV